MINDESSISDEFLNDAANIDAEQFKNSISTLFSKPAMDTSAKEVGLSTAWAMSDATLDLIKLKANPMLAGVAGTSRFLMPADSSVELSAECARNADEIFKALNWVPVIRERSDDGYYQFVFQRKEGSSFPPPFVRILLDGQPLDVLVTRNADDVIIVEVPELTIDVEKFVMESKDADVAIRIYTDLV